MHPPYKGTTGYNGVAGFDSAAFWDWVRAQPALVVVSELQAPSDFVCVKSFTKRYAMANKFGGP